MSAHFRLANPRFIRKAFNQIEQKKLWMILTMLKYPTKIYKVMKTMKTDEDLTEPAKEMYICIISDITSDIVGLGSLCR
ncbi:MAG: hypothetical protein WA395_02625 [Nitrososphaeraceae archaeon]